jgi:F0F1-type ATP synthase membrane subunit a
MLVLYWGSRREPKMHLALITLVGVVLRASAKMLLVSFRFKKHFFELIVSNQTKICHVLTHRRLKIRQLTTLFAFMIFRFYWFCNVVPSGHRKERDTTLLLSNPTESTNTD